MKSNLFIIIFLVCFQLMFSQKQKSYSLNHLNDLSVLYLLDNKKIYAEEQLAFLTISELKLLRNLPFARKGLIFKDRDLTLYFSKYNWYKPTKNSVENVEFNKQEKDNLELILSFEKAIKIKTDESNYVEILSGSWQIYSTTVAAGYDDVFVFSSLDKSFAFFANTKKRNSLLREYSGWFVINKNVLELDIADKIVMQKVYKPDYVDPITRKKVKRAEYRAKVIDLHDAHEFKTFLISEITLITIDGLDKAFVKIGNDIYWKIVYEPQEGC